MKSLTHKEYLATMNSPMTNVTDNANPTVDIWPHVRHLVDLKLVPERVLENYLVEAVYRDPTNSFDHVLLPTGSKTVMACLIVDIRNRNVVGYHMLDLAKEYGLDE